jgi:tRNA/rRNA methyltransferase
LYKEQTLHFKPPEDLTWLGQVAIVLRSPSHPGNIGATARAMKVMGLRDLRVVSPRFADACAQPEAQAFASGALDVLAAARVFASLDDALADAHWTVAMAMVPRQWSGPQTQPRAAALEARARLNDGRSERVAFVFGPERTGLSNEDLLRCRVACQIPADEQYGSLNLAQAVQVMGYELRMAALEGRSAPLTGQRDALATHAAVQGMLADLEQALIAIGFLDPAVPKRLMPRLASLFARTELTTKEIDILRGIAAQMREPKAARARSRAGGSADEQP